MFNVVLVEPRIPQNTGNIARTCAATGCGLHLVRPMAFEIDDKKLKRAGLDYWQYLTVQYYDGLDDFFAKTASPDARYHYATTKAPHTCKSMLLGLLPDGIYGIQNSLRSSSLGDQGDVSTRPPRPLTTPDPLNEQGMTIPCIPSSGASTFVPAPRMVGTVSSVFIVFNS